MSLSPMFVLLSSIIQSLAPKDECTDLLTEKNKIDAETVAMAELLLLLK